MTTREELMLKMGVDNSAVSKGMRGLRSTVSEGLGDIKNEIAGAFTTGAVIGFFDKVIDHFDEMKEHAENLDVGTDFFQGMSRTFETNGSSAEKFSKGMDKLNVKIGEAKNGNQQAIASFEKIGITLAQLDSMSVEDIFYAVADGLKKTGDNSIIAAGAVDIFGKSGASMVTVINQGSEALKRMVDGAQKLSEADVQFLHQTKDDLKNASETAMVWGGKLLGLVKDVASAYGEMSAVGWGKDRSAAIKERVHQAQELAKAALLAKIHAAQAAEDEAKAAAEKSAADKSASAAADKKRRDDEEAEAQAKRANDLLREQNKLLGEKWKAAQKASKLAKEIGDAQRGRTDWTLGEVAGLNPNMLNRQSRWKIGAAQQVEDMRKEAKFERLEDNTSGANDLLKRSDVLAKSIGGLSAAEADPIGTLVAQGKEMLDAMNAIGATAEGDTLRVAIKDNT